MAHSLAHLIITSSGADFRGRLEEIHARVQETLAEDIGEPAADGPVPATPADTTIVSVFQPAQLPGIVPGQVTEPEITEEYLQQLAINGDIPTLSTLLDNNGECSPA